MKKYLALILVSIFITSCNNNDDVLSHDNKYTEYIIEKSISSDINFMPKELHEGSGVVEKPSLKLELVTTKIFPCVNYEITTTVFIKNDELIIRFEEIFISNICFTAFGPAVSYVSLPENIKTLTLINGDNIDKYSIEINTHQVSISLIENNFTNSLYNKTFRFPEKTFAYVCGTNTNNTYLYTDFLTLLQNNPLLTEHSFNGDGRIPYPEKSSGHWVDKPSVFFKYTNELDFDELGQVLDIFSSQYLTPTNDVTISLTNWENKKHYSWD